MLELKHPNTMNQLYDVKRIVIPFQSNVMWLLLFLVNCRLQMSIQPI